MNIYTWIPLLFYIVTNPYIILTAERINQLSRNSVLDPTHLKSTIGALYLAQNLWVTDQNDNMSNTELFNVLKEAHSLADTMLFNSPPNSFIQSNRMTIENNYIEHAVLSPCGTYIVGRNQYKELAKLNLYTKETSSIIADNFDPDCIDFNCYGHLICASADQIINFKNKLNEKTDYEVTLTGDPTITLAAHKRMPLYVFVTSDSRYNTVKLSNMHDNQAMYIATLDKNNNLTLKWNPQEASFAIKNGTELLLYDTRSNNKCAQFSNISRSVQFDFNSDGTLICTANLKKNYSIIDLRTHKMVSTPTKFSSNQVCNVYKDLFIAQMETFKDELTIFRGSDVLGSPEEAKGTRTDISPHGILLPNRNTGNVYVYTVSKDTHNMNIHYYEPTTMLGTEIDTKAIKKHNLACFYAIARARDEHEMKMLLDPTFNEPIQDTANIDRCFRDVLTNVNQATKNTLQNSV